MVHACNHSYSGGWVGRITGTQETEVVVSQDCATAPHSGWQSGKTLSSKKKEKTLEKPCPFSPFVIESLCGVSSQMPTFILPDPRGSHCTPGTAFLVRLSLCWLLPCRAPVEHVDPRIWLWRNPTLQKSLHHRSSQTGEEMPEPWGQPGLIPWVTSQSGYTQLPSRGSRFLHTANFTLWIKGQRGQEAAAVSGRSIRYSHGAVLFPHVVCFFS